MMHPDIIAVLLIQFVALFYIADVDSAVVVVERMQKQNEQSLSEDVQPVIASRNEDFFPLLMFLDTQWRMARSRNAREAALKKKRLAEERLRNDVEVWERMVRDDDSECGAECQKLKSQIGKSDASEEKNYTHAPKTEDTSSAPEWKGWWDLKNQDAVVNLVDSEFEPISRRVTEVSGNKITSETFKSDQIEDKGKGEEVSTASPSTAVTCGGGGGDGCNSCGKCTGKNIVGKESKCSNDMCQESDHQSHQGGDHQSRQGSDHESHQGSDHESHQGSDHESHQGSDHQRHKGGDHKSHQGCDHQSSRAGDHHTHQVCDQHGHKGGDHHVHIGGDHVHHGGEHHHGSGHHHHHGFDHRQFSTSDIERALEDGDADTLIRQCLQYLGVSESNVGGMDESLPVATRLCERRVRQMLAQRSSNNVVIIQPEILSPIDLLEDDAASPHLLAVLVARKAALNSEVQATVDDSRSTSSESTIGRRLRFVRRQVAPTQQHSADYKTKKRVGETTTEDTEQPTTTISTNTEDTGTCKDEAAIESTGPGTSRAADSASLSAKNVRPPDDNKEDSEGKQLVKEGHSTEMTSDTPAQAPEVERKVRSQEHMGFWEKVKNFLSHFHSAESVPNKSRMRRNAQDNSMTALIHDTATTKSNDAVERHSQIEVEKGEKVSSNTKAKFENTQKEQNARSESTLKRNVVQVRGDSKKEDLIPNN